MKFLGKKKEPAAKTEAAAEKKPAVKAESASGKNSKVKIKPQKKQAKSKKRF